MFYTIQTYNTGLIYYNIYLCRIHNMYIMLVVLMHTTYDYNNILYCTHLHRVSNPYYYAQVNL